MSPTPTKVFITGITGYIGGTFIDLWLKNDDAKNFSYRALVRSASVAEKSIRPLGVEPVVGSLDDTDLLTRESADADVVLHFADADHLPAAKAILKGLSEPRKQGAARTRPILIHTSGTGVLTDSVYGYHANEEIYYDNNVKQLSTLPDTQIHRLIDLEILSPSLVGHVDTYIVAPPTIIGYGTGPVNQNSVQIPFQVRSSLRHGNALQVGKGLNIWNKVHVVDLAKFYILLLQRSLQEPQASGAKGTLPKNQDAYWFAEDGEFTWGEVAKFIARAFVTQGINKSGEVQGTSPEEEEAVWPPNSRPGRLIGANSRSRAVKAREILGWAPELHDLEGHVAQEVERQIKEDKYRN
ncbi:hypothetical protein BGZ59_007419 [Podila verticillata]|nr:hypothetical protein BGZ59_007419 [Podila verticillata]KAI9236653.1 MAG: NAD-P-binding protein [Podila humilis]KFH69498.1 hypothetical protein MVEG_04310 [Podila verticillata NRRL 6337]